MNKLFADTNIFGIAVDPEEDRRKSVWSTLEEAVDGDYRLLTSETVLTEIEENPHKPTREKEKELVDIVVDEVVEASEDALELSEKLEEEADTGIVDSRILATAILKESTFWTGDYELLNQQTTEKITEVVEEFDPGLEFHYMIE